MLVSWFVVIDQIMYVPASPLPVPFGPVTAYFLSGEWFPGDARPHRRPPDGRVCFRDAPVLRRMAVPAWWAVHARETIAAVESYGGEPMRCFYPRHGLSFATGDGSPVDVLVCLQCHLLYFCEGERGEFFALTERARQRLGVFFSYFGPIVAEHFIP